MSNTKIISAPSALTFPWIIVGIALALAVVGGALGLGIRIPPGIAVLVVGASVLLAAILAFWNSVRTLTGELALPGELEVESLKSGGLRSLEERKRAVLRALKDIEAERAIGKIDDQDFDAMQARYREEAKEIFRELDATVEPFRARAEALVAAHLASVGLTNAGVVDASKPAETSKPIASATASANSPADAFEDDDAQAAPKVDAKPSADAKPAVDSKNDRKTCTQCGTSNEIDAKFCKSCSESLDSSAIV